mmetsp:Transcript_41293/g.30363  ORF Transcript_41293/g.30363 Transcript_41293/m.30363 type:complete len:103 (+) Transcript_41293:119-427(+)
MASVEHDRQQFGSDITSIRELFKSKVDVKDFIFVSEQVSNCAPWETVRNVYKELAYYIKIDEFEKHRIQLENQIKKVDGKLEVLMKKKEAEVAIDEAKREVI